jgi:hypothetical protein
VKLNRDCKISQQPIANRMPVETLLSTRFEAVFISSKTISHARAVVKIKLMFRYSGRFSSMQVSVEETKLN